MSDTLGFGIIGAGMIAENHRAAVLANADNGARLVSVAHYDPARFDTIAAEYGVPCVRESDLLSDPAVDVVCICTPSGYHAAQTLAAAEAGKHVLVEKPMALTEADADAMIAACAAAGVTLGVTFQSRTQPLYRDMQRAIQAGDLGEVTLGVVTMPYFRPMAYYNQAEWRGTWAMDGGGVLMNQGIHQVDLLLWLMGDPVAVNAFAGTHHHDVAVEDTLAAALHFANGAAATITASTSAGTGFPHRVEVYGTAGGIQTEGGRLVRWRLADPARAAVTPPPAATDLAAAGAGGDPRGIGTQSHIALFTDFIDAVRTGRDPVVNGQEGRRSVKTTRDIYRAAGLLGTADEH